MKHLTLLLASLSSFPVLANVVTPNAINLQSVTDGPAPSKPDIRIDTPGSWTLSIPSTLNTFLRVDPSWASAASGSGPATVRLVITRIPPPGTYSGQITITSGAISAPVYVSYKVVAAYPAPQFSSLLDPLGPRECAAQTGFVGPAPSCKVPGISPAGATTPSSAFADYNFGGLQRIVGSEPTLHGYASPTVFSARNKYLLGGSMKTFSAEVYSLADGKKAHADLSTPFQGVLWDAYDDEVFYTLRGAQIRSFNMTSKQWSTVADFTGQFTTITNGSTGDTSKDNWIAFFAPQEKTVCAFNLSTKRSYCHNYGTLGNPAGDALTKLPAQNIDFSMISKGVDSVSGKRYVLLMAEPAMVVYSVNETTNSLQLVSRGPEISGGNNDGFCDPGEKCFSSRHSDVFESSDGQQWLLTVFDTITPATRNLVSYRLNSKNLGVREELGGGMRKIVQLYPGGTQWMDHHVGCAKNAPTCVVSMQTNLSAQPGGTVNVPPYGGQLFLVRNNKEIRQIGYHRSIQISGEVAGSYWSRARACLSNDGRYVLFTSNFGKSNDYRIVLLDSGVWQ